MIRWIAVRLAVYALAAVLAGLLFSVIVALARDNGQWQHADQNLRDWVRGLTDRHGISCCDEADGEEVEGWTFGADGYMVKVKGQWLPVPYSAQLDIPNKLGYARVWLRYDSGKPVVRCFIAGAGG